MREGPVDDARRAEQTIVLLQRAAEGDILSRDEAWARVFDEVLQVAAAHRRRWSGDWTLETRALASEVFLKLCGGASPAPNDRKHFFVLVSLAIRQVLLNYAESRRALKRGGDHTRVTLRDRNEPFMTEVDAERFLSLEQVLRRFGEIDPRAAQVVELRFFAGLTYDEIAEALNLSRFTVVRDWSIARGWLSRELSEDSSGASSPGPVGAVTMSPPWESVREVLGRLLEIPIADRAAVARLICESDDVLHREVWSLLCAHEADGVVDQFYVRLRRREDAGGDPSRVRRWVGEYRLQALLGEGGMGSVYRAAAPDGETVALKILRGPPSPVLARRFQIELAGLRRLSHPCICGVHHSGLTADGVPFFVMDLVEGELIDHFLDARCATVADRTRLLLDVCDTVAYAHANGVLHRDLKPSNVLVRDDGSHVLLDFGIAKFIESRAVAEPSTLTKRACVYTPHFSSPEQIEGRAVSAQCDVFSLGVLGYLLVSGRLPTYRRATSDFALPDDPIELRRLADLRSTTPARLRGELHGELRRVLRAATGLDASDRTRSVTGFAAGLRRASPRGVRGLRVPSGWADLRRRFEGWVG